MRKAIFLWNCNDIIEEIILKFNQHMNSKKMLYMIYIDLESLIKKIDGCANKPKKSPSVKTGENVYCGYSMPAIWTFDTIEKKKTQFISWTRLYETFL